MTLSETPALLLLAPACLAGWCICPLTQCRKSIVQECAALSICQPACRARAHDPTKFVVSPITGELIPVDQMSEHMRVSMIDPRFQEQRNAMLAKIRDTTKAGDDEISRNLMTLAKKRPDVFGELSAVQGSVRQSFGCHPTFLPTSLPFQWSASQQQCCSSLPERDVALAVLLLDRTPLTAAMSA